MRQYLAIVAMAAMSGCGSGKENSVQEVGADGDGSRCDIVVSETFPEADDFQAYYKTDVRFSLSAEDPTATIAVTDASGTEVPGTTTVSGSIVTWSGAVDLAPETTYTATLNYQCGEAPITFTTSDTGKPTEVDISGFVYELDLESGEWVQPVGVGALISTHLGAVEVLVSPTTVTTTEITMIGALGDGTGAQDMCTPSFDFGQAAAWNDPYFELASEQLTLDVAGTVVDIEDLVLSGAFAPDGTRIQGTSLQGYIDTRQLNGLLESGDDLCSLVAIVGAECEPCTDGSGTFCLSVHVDNIRAEQVPGASPLEVVVQGDIDADPTCGG